MMADPTPAPVGSVAHTNPTARQQRWRPSEAVSPGFVLREEIAARGISQAELAIRTGLSPKHVNQVIQAVVPLSADVALLLERVLDIPSYFWNGLEADFRDAQVRSQAHDRLLQHLSWAKLFPIAELKRHGILHSSDTGTVVVEKLLSFFGVADPDAFDRLWSTSTAAFRRSPHHPIDFHATASWLRLAELRAADISLSPFDGRRFATVLPTLRALTMLPFPQAMSELQRQCADVGVAVVQIPEIKGTRACGATRWVGASYPIVVLSGRYKTEDSVWFSFFHESGHLIRHPKKVTYINPEPGSGDKDTPELEADRFAQDALVPPDVVPHLSHLHTAQEITAFAERIGVAPGIVAGRMANDKLTTWAASRSLRRSL